MHNENDIEVIKRTTNKVVRSVRHSLLFANIDKKLKLHQFLNDYRYAVYLFIDYLWDNRLEFDNNKVLDIKNEEYYVPKYIANVYLENKMDDRIKQSPLSARAKACALSQAISMIKASIEKAKRFQYVIHTKYEGKLSAKQQIKKAQKKPRKPHCENIKAELRSLCATLEENRNDASQFNYIIRLKSLGSKYGSLIIPTKKTRCDDKFITQGFSKMGSLLISDFEFDIRYFKDIEERTEGETLGCDQGMKDTLTLSNGVTTPLVDNHGKTVDYLYHKLSRKKKGSKAFRKAEIELTNFVNWQVKQTVSRLKNVKSINLEKVVNIRFHQTTSRLMSHWSNPRIVDSLKRHCEVSGVHIHEESSTYMSQRCSNCGLVRKANRKGKVYKCPHCGHEMDADLNAAINHTVALPPIDWRFRKLNFNRGNGFFWKPDGLYSRGSGGELGVHLDPISGKPMEDFS